MPELPARGWVLLGALATFAAVVMGVLLWASLSGQAGSQRGLVIHNGLSQAVLVAVARQEVRIDPGHEATFVVKPEQFPSDIFVTQTTTDPEAFGRLVFNERWAYDDLADAEFRLSIDENGIYRTTDYRDTPAPAP